MNREDTRKINKEMVMTKQFPDTLFVKIETSDGEDYFVANEEVYGLVELGVKIKVAAYRLVEISTAEAVVKIEPDTELTKG